LPPAERKTVVKLLLMSSGILSIWPKTSTIFEWSIAKEIVFPFVLSISKESTLFPSAT